MNTHSLSPEGWLSYMAILFGQVDEQKGKAVAIIFGMTESIAIYLQF